MNVLALCAGYGGLEIGISLAVPGARTVCHVEGEVHAVATLVESMGKEIVDESPVWSDARTFDARPWRGVVDCVSGGYPCQPFSCAGSRGGSNDPRHLWPHFKRIIGECEPSVCFFENVAGHVSLGLEMVLDDLRDMGYQVAAGLFTAAEVGASQKRERVFIMAYDPGRGRDHASYPEPGIRIGPHEETGKDDSATAGGASFAVGDDNPQRELQQNWSIGDERGWAGDSGENLAFPPHPDDLQLWSEVLEMHPSLEPALCRMADGLADRVHRLRGLGNGVCPLQAAYAWLTLASAFG